MAARIPGLSVVVLRSTSVVLARGLGYGFAEFCHDNRERGGIFFTDYKCDSQPLTLRNVLLPSPSPPPAG